MKIRFDALVSSYLGESASNLRAVFDAAREKPCVLLLVECDFIARSRTTSKNVGEIARIVNTLLQLMKEYNAPGLLVATTNIENSLDEVLFRRFDDELLSQTLSGVERAKDIRWADIVNQLNGESAAYAVRVAQAATKSAVLSGKRVVEQAHFENAISELKLPPSSE